MKEEIYNAWKDRLIKKISKLSKYYYTKEINSGHSPTFEQVEPYNKAIFDVLQIINQE